MDDPFIKILLEHWAGFQGVTLLIIPPGLVEGGVY